MLDLNWRSWENCNQDLVEWNWDFHDSQWDVDGTSLASSVFTDEFVQAITVQGNADETDYDGTDQLVRFLLEFYVLIE